MEVQVETIALVRDLLFSSKISTTARLLGVRERLRLLRDASQLEAIDAKRLIVDLNADGALEAAVTWKARTGGSVIGFVSHVAGDAIAAARAMGIDRVMSNGSFSANVDSVLKGE